MVIIIDQKDFEDPSSVIMSDDGTGAGIQIPAMLISKSDGEILKRFILENEAELVKKAAINADFIENN